MNNTIQTIFLGIITVTLVILVIIVYSQEMKITKLEQVNKVATTQSEPSEKDIVKLASDEVSNINKLAQQTVFDSNKGITGEIKSIADNTITVEAVVTNVAGLGQVDFSKSSNLGFIKKTYQVIVAPTTIFAKGKLAQLKAGDIIQASSDSSVLTVDRFTAKEISFFNPGN